MKNTFKLIIALVAIIGFSFAACDNGSSGGSTPDITSSTFTIFSTQLMDSEVPDVIGKSASLGNLVFSDKSKDAALTTCNTKFPLMKQTGVSGADVTDFLNSTGLPSDDVNQILTKIQSNGYVLLCFGSASDVNDTFAAFKE